MATADWIQVVQAMIMLATGGVVVWYTRETQRLRENAEAQLEHLGKSDARASAPVLGLTFGPRQGNASHTRELWLRNFGTGAAFSVQIEPTNEKAQKLDARLSEQVSVLSPHPQGETIVGRVKGDDLSRVTGTEFRLSATSILGIRYEFTVQGVVDETNRAEFMPVSRKAYPTASDQG